MWKSKDGSPRIVVLYKRNPRLPDYGKMSQVAKFSKNMNRLANLSNKKNPRLVRRDFIPPCGIAYWIGFKDGQTQKGS